VAAADKGAPTAFAVSARGAGLGGQVARLVDRGYQKFLKTAHVELPATASQLHAIHLFSEELKQVTGAIELYNESLGTTAICISMTACRAVKLCRLPHNARGAHRGQGAECRNVGNRE